MIKRMMFVAMFVVLMGFVGGCQWPFEKKFPFRDGGRIAPVNTPRERQRIREEGRGKWAWQYKSGKPYRGTPRQLDAGGYPRQPKPHGIGSAFKRK